MGQIYKSYLPLFCVSVGPVFLSLIPAPFPVVTSTAVDSELTIGGCLVVGAIVVGWVGGAVTVNRVVEKL